MLLRRLCIRSDLSLCSSQTTTAKRKSNKKKTFKNILRNLWDNIRHTNICNIGSQKEKKERGRFGNVCDEIMAENFPNLKKETETETQRVLNKMNPHRPRPGHNIIKMANVKERILKSGREKQIVI